MSWTLRFGLVLLFTVLVAPARPAGEVAPTNDPIETVKKAVAERKARLVDVREREEWDRGHLRDAALVPLSTLKAGAAAAARALHRDAPLYLHCRSGKRSLEAAKLLKKLGYDARPLALGYEQLVAAGFGKAP